MDTQKEERARGVTISCTTKEFFTEKWHYTIIDAPGEEQTSSCLLKCNLPHSPHAPESTILKTHTVFHFVPTRLRV